MSKWVIMPGGVVPEPVVVVELPVGGPVLLVDDEEGDEVEVGTNRSCTSFSTAR